MRFSLMSLLLAFVVIWSALATFGVAGLVVAAVLLGIAAYVRSARHMGKAILTVLAVVLLILVLIALTLPLHSAAREAARRVQCRNNLKQLGLALYNYHDKFGCFPPAYVPGPDGKPWHSWRVLILPFIEQTPLYDQYDFNEPWDGPNNRKLARPKPFGCCCPSDPDSDNSPNTNYVAVVGPRAAWVGSEPRTQGDFGDGTDSTIIVVEVADSGIHWMEPRDLSFDDARTGVHPPGRAAISGHHIISYGHFYRDEPGANVAMADGSVRSLPERISQATLEAMLTIDGKEPIDFDSLPELQPRLNWSRVFAPIVLIVSYLILLLRPRKQRKADRQEATP
jgi:prepilin-type processing-associated H-X9-DG protein